MKILYVLHQFFPFHHTGTERLTLQLAKQIQRLGNFVSVLTYEPNNLNIEGFEQLDNNVKKREYQFETIPVRSFKHVESNSGMDYVFDPSVERHLTSIVKQFDLVHFTHTQRLGSVLKICKDLKIPTILTLTDNWLLCPTGLLTTEHDLCDGPDEGKKCMSVCRYSEKFLQRYNDAKYFFDNVDRIFSGSEFVRSTFQENGWKRNIELNTFSVDYSYVKPVDENHELVFGFIGSLVWHKGLHVLIQALNQIKDPKIKVKVYGKGAEGDPYATKVLELVKKDHRIEFCGTFEYKDLPQIMKDLSVIVIPSTYKEIYPLVMQLSLAYKKPVIATKIGGMPEVIQDGVNGYLFEIGNVDQLSSIISKISQNPSLVSKIKDNIVSPPRIEEEAFMYENTYRKLINSKS
jgi:glycosyltransferase involved in cell wall biosynthesis